MESLIAEEARSSMDVFGLLVVVVIAAIIAAVLLGVNSRRLKRGEPLRNPSAAVAAIAFLVAALVMLMVAINLEIPWAVAMSGVSVAGTLTYLAAMLARGVPRTAGDELRDYGAPSGGAPKNRASWLEISAQIAGILSLVVSVIALLSD